MVYVYKTENVQLKSMCENITCSVFRFCNTETTAHKEDYPDNTSADWCAYGNWWSTPEIKDDNSYKTRRDCKKLSYTILTVLGNKLLELISKKLPNTEQSSKGKGKTHMSTTGKLGKPQWPWLGTGISKEMVGWIRFYGAKSPASITVKRFRLSL